MAYRLNPLGKGIDPINERSHHQPFLRQGGERWGERAAARADHRDFVDHQWSEGERVLTSSEGPSLTSPTNSCPGTP